MNTPNQTLTGEGNAPRVSTTEKLPNGFEWGWNLEGYYVENLLTKSYVIAAQNTPAEAAKND